MHNAKCRMKNEEFRQSIAHRRGAVVTRGSRLEDPMDRRAFVVNAFTTFAVGQPLLADAHQTRPDVPTYWADVPPGGTLWGVVVFTSAEPVEITIAAGKSGKTIRGQFDAQRLTEYSWRNTSDGPERVAVRAKALSANRELPA